MMISRLLPTMKLQVDFMEAQKSLISTADGCTSLPVSQHVTALPLNDVGNACGRPMAVEQNG